MEYLFSHIDRNIFNGNLSIMEASKRFFENVNQTTILAQDYLKFISNVTNRSYQSVLGTTIGYQYPKLGGRDWFNSDWTYQKSSKTVPAQFVKGKTIIDLGKNYDSQHNFL